MNRFTPTRREIRGGFLNVSGTWYMTPARTPGNDRVTKMTNSSEYLYLGLFRATAYKKANPRHAI